MAAGRWLSHCVWVAILISLATAQNVPPEISGSYMAYGEMVESLEDESKLLTQVAFEESFDAQNKNAAFRVRVMGRNVTFVENFDTNQTFQFADGACTQMTVTEWIDTKSPPSLLNYEDTNGKVRFSLKQLFSLDNKFLEERDVPSTFRGIAARKWMYKIEGKEANNSRRLLNVYEYWSDGTWNTSSHDESIPLGFVVSKLLYKQKVAGVKVHEQLINVFGFVLNAVDQKLFEPHQGVVCPNRTSTLKFPDVSNLQTMALHSEFVLPDYSEVKYIDMWYDSNNKLLRTDMERIKDEAIPSEVPDKSRNYQSEIAARNLDVVFRQTYHKGQITCSVIPFETFEFDVQNLVNFKLPRKEWRTERMFGLNSTKYTYIGTSTKRDMPCHVFQGVRTDWPDPSVGVTSLWEWCFSINMTKTNNIVIFRNGEYGLVDAQVKILKSANPGDFPPDFRMNHHFYHVTRKNPNEMELRYFDISRCFEENEKRALQFQVDVEINDDNFQAMENATSDFNFLHQWKLAIYKYAVMQPSTLRLADVKSEVTNKKLYVKFVILPPHKDLPEPVKKQQNSTFVAETKFRDTINKGGANIVYKASDDAKPMTLNITRHSVQFQVNRTFEPHVLPSTVNPPISTTRKIPFSLATDPDDRTTTQSTPRVKVSSTTASTDKPMTGSSLLTTTNRVTSPRVDLRDVSLRHGGGTVAGVAIAMLLVGVTVGSAGIFVKYNGLPACLK